MIRIAALALLAACQGGGDDPGTSADDTGSTAGSTEPEPAALADVSAGACPDMSEGGLLEIESGGLDREFTLVLPEGGTEGAGVVFFFHGLSNAGSSPSAYFASALDIQDLADETGSIVLMPDSRTMEMFGYEFYMWEVAEQDDLDLTLFDDLRTCAVEQLGGDVSRLTAGGFSGGALFTTVIMRERGDTLAAAVELSGGADGSVPVWDEPVSHYETSAHQMPVLLVSGGEDDEWPQGFAVLEFEAMTDTLEAGLVADGHFVTRCRHDRGHTVTNTTWGAAVEWLTEHSFGVESPWVEAGVSWDDCDVVESGD